MLNRRSFVRGAVVGVGAMAVVGREVAAAAQEPTMSLNVPRWTPENRQFVDGSKPAITASGPRLVSSTS